MLLLHTSDWHLGHELYGNDRSAEFVAMLHQMRDIVSSRKPDVFLISGDIFDTAFPSSAVQTMFTEAIVDIHNAHPGMCIVITSGNHDSASRHEIFRQPWRALNVHALGRIDAGNPAENIIDLPGVGHIVAVPYVHEKMMPAGYYQTLLDAVADDGLPVVLSAHTTVRGASFDGHRHITDESTDTVGNIAARDIRDMGNGFDYLALGHIHKAQFVHGAGHHRVRYCGSPLPISFDEPKIHSVSLVSIAERGAEPLVEEIPIFTPRALVTLPDDGSFVKWERALELLREHVPAGPEYVRLNVLVDAPLPDDRHKLISEAVEGKDCIVCRINPKRAEAPEGHTARTRTVSEFKDEDPLVIAREYAAYNGTPLTDEMVELFKEVYNRVSPD